MALSRHYLGPLLSIIHFFWGLLIVLDREKVHLWRPDLSLLASSKKLLVHILLRTLQLISRMHFLMT